MKHKKGFLKYYLAIIGLIVLSIFVYNQKSDSAILHWFVNRIKFKDVDGSIKSFDGKIQFQSEIEKMQHDLDKTNKRLTWCVNHMTLLAILANENMEIISKGHDRSQLIFLNKDWTINKMPKYIKLDQDDKEFLQQFLRTKDQ